MLGSVSAQPWTPILVSIGVHGSTDVCLERTENLLHVLAEVVLKTEAFLYIFFDANNDFRVEMIIS